MQIASVRLGSDTPIVGVELNPYVLLRRADGSCTTEEGEGFFVRCRWLRSSYRQRASSGVCSAHLQPATLQSVQFKTFHCSNECFLAGGREEGFEGAGFKHSYTGFTAGGGAPESWTELSTFRAYTPMPDDVGYALRFECTPVDAASGQELAAATQLTLAQRVVAAPQAAPRRMVPLVPESRDRSGRFTVLTYNVLSDIYASSELYSYCPPWALSWSFRRQNLLRELLSYDADVLCLQEIQSDHYEDFFLPELTRAGYSAVYKRKTGEMFTGGAYAFDGCATFFRKDSFTLIKKYEVEFNKAAGPVAEACSTGASREKATQRLMKNNVALILVLEAREGSRAAPAGSAGKRPLLCVANTHIHANPELNDVKLWQVHTLLKGLEKIAASAEIPMVVCGDFNSMPLSAAHFLLTSGRVDPSHPELATDPLGILRPASKLCHALPLTSVYAAAAVPGQHPGGDAALPDGGAGVARLRERLDLGGPHGEGGSGEPLFTNCTAGFTGTLDYIFFTRDALVPTAVLDLPEEEAVRGPQGAAGGLPSAVRSSDHVCIMAELQVRVADERWQGPGRGR